MISHLTFNKPILLVGNGVRSANAQKLLLDFSKKTNIPILTTMNAVDLAQGENHIGFIGTHGNRIANIILKNCDLVISIGARLGIRQVGRFSKNFAPNAKLIRNDIDHNELSRNIKEDEMKYLMDASQFIKLLNDEPFANYMEWKQKCFEAKEIISNVDKTEGNLCIEFISTLLPVNPIVTVDVGQNQCWAAQSLHLKGTEGRILLSGGYGTMGCSLPYSIGASIYYKDNPIFCLSGDGGFQMNIQELETVKRENLPIKMLVLNNKVLGKISETQHFNHQNRFAQTTSESGYTVPSFEKIAAAYGIKSVKLQNYKELIKYKEWLYDNEPCLINIMLNEESFLIPKIKWETGEVFPTIEDNLIKKVNDILK